MKAHLLFLVVAISSVVTAQTIKIEKGIATLDGKQWLVVQETPVDKTTTYVVLKNLTSEIVAQLTFTDNGDKVFFRGTFPTVKKEYEINYPAGTGIQTILESFNRNKIIVDSKIDQAGLEKYSSDRGIMLAPLSAPLGETTVEPAKKNVSSSIQPAADNATQAPVSKLVYFDLKNNSSNIVRYFIGTDPKYGSGTTKTTGGNNISSESGQTGEKFCIIDEHDNPISCTNISEGMGRVEINSSGTGFGY